MTTISETERELQATIEKRVRLARLDGQIDLLGELEQRPPNTSEREWIMTRLAQLQDEVRSL
jgi:hypothetical protein